MLPWWTTPVLRLAFLRPLASLTLAAAAGAVFRRAIPEARVAALAALLFAVDHTHAMPVVWLSNRHAVMSAVFALAAFATHLRWRQDEWSPGRVLASGLGAMGLLARALDGAWWSGAATTRGARAVLAVLATIHLVLSPLLLVARSHQIASVSAGYVGRADASLPTGAGLHEGLVVAVTAPDPLTTPYAFSRRVAEGRPWPRRGARLLVTPSAGVTTLRREGPRSVVVTASVPMPHDKLGPLYRGLAQPFRMSEVIETDGMTATVVERAEDGRARSVRFTFARDLDDPMYRWVHWVDGRFAAFPLPAVGATVTLAPIDWLKAMAGP